MKREDVLEMVHRYRQARDRSRAYASFGRPYTDGMHDGFHLAAHWLWREFRDEWKRRRIVRKRPYDGPMGIFTDYEGCDSNED